MIDANALAREIRRVDGSHSLGAAALAEALIPWLEENVLGQEERTDDAEVEQLKDMIRHLTQNPDFDFEAALAFNPQAKRMPGVTYGCHLDLEPGQEPDNCVIDTNERHLCIYAKSAACKEQCEYWMPKVQL